MENEINELILQAFENLYSMSTDIQEWIIVKKTILLMLPSPIRKQFSTRHEKTKRQIPNKLEYRMMQHWANLIQKPVFYTNDLEHGQINPQ